MVLVIGGIIASALWPAWRAAADLQQDAPEQRAAAEHVMRFEEKLTNLLSNAYITADATDTTTFFIGAPAEGAQAAQANSLIFTMQGDRPPGRYLTTEEEDFQLLNEQFGPQGGIAEISLSTSPVGNVGDQQGLFLREQRPSDGDSSQGGFESLLEPDIESINFEFFDGTSWQTEWDTEIVGRRLPASVRITYRLADEDDDRILVVALKNSDVTPDNPATQTTGATTG